MVSSKIQSHPLFTVLRRFRRDTINEWRRRLITWVLLPYYRATDARLRCIGELPATGIRRILVCRPNHRLGNQLLLTPLLAELEQVFPLASIDLVLAGDEQPELFRAFPRVDRTYCLPRHMAKHPIQLARLLWQIRATGYDLAIDPCESSRSGRLLLGLSKAAHAIGLPSVRPLTEPRWRQVAQLAPQHMAQLPVFLLRVALAQSPPAVFDYPPLDIRLSAEEREQAGRTLDQVIDGPHSQPPALTIGIFAGATGAKRYDAAWWTRFVSTIAEQRAGCRIIEIAPPDGRASTGLPTFSSPSHRKVAAMIANLAYFVSADCGVMHLACASGAPTLGLFCASDEPKYRPYGQFNRSIQTAGKTPEELAQFTLDAIAALGR